MVFAVDGFSNSLLFIANHTLGQLFMKGKRL
jgi:hypothetical protein